MVQQGQAARASRVRETEVTGGPAVIHPGGREEWYHEGELHREGDQPARIFLNGRQEWCRKDLLHRDGDQPAVISETGLWEWYHDGVAKANPGVPATGRRASALTGNMSGTVATATGRCASASTICRSGTAKASRTATATSRRGTNPDPRRSSWVNGEQS